MEGALKTPPVTAYFMQRKKISFISNHVARIDYAVCIIPQSSMLRSIRRVMEVGAFTEIHISITAAR